MDRLDIIIDNNNNNNNNNNTKNAKKGLMQMQWTNEKHSNFLRFMEASFVRNLMAGATTATANDDDDDTATTTTAAKSGGKSHRHHLLHPVHPRLDRFIPDISESTLDSSNRSAHSSVRVSRTCNRQKGRAIIRPYKMSHDQVVPQVVPQLEDISGDKGV